MNNPSAPSIQAEDRKVSYTALVLMVGGYILPLLCWIFWLPQPLLFVACGLEVAALVIGWRMRPHGLAKSAVRGAQFFFTLGIILGLRGLPTYQQKVSASADWMQPLNSTWVLQSPGRPYSIQTTVDLKKNGDDSLRFELRDGEHWTDQTFMPTFRAEVATKEFPPAGTERWYAFSVFFPTNFPIEDNRLVFAQWKEKEAFLGTGLIPSLAFRVVKGKFSITLRHSAEKVIHDSDSVPSEDLFKK